MNYIIIISIVCVLAYILVQLWQLYSLLRYRPKKFSAIETENLPRISIWVACRNEERNIAACLDALLALDYPKDKLQILVGNDQSTDNTRNIILHYCELNKHVQLIDIVDTNDGLKAKARVMAQMDKFADGEYYLITDADVEVKPSWAKSLIEFLDKDMGVASGTTMVKGASLDAKMQEIDWVYFMGLLNAISYSGLPATAVGNNMIVKKEAYWQTGGYGNIRFSITEDYKLYSEICAKGWNWNNVMHPDVLAYSKKTSGFKPLLHQRKRWLSGGKELPWYWWLLFVIYASFFFLIPVILLLNWKMGLLLWGIKFVLQTTQIFTIYSHIKEPFPSITAMILYEFYLFIVTICTAIFFMLPIKTNWKERKY